MVPNPTIRLNRPMAVVSPHTHSSTCICVERPQGMPAHAPAPLLHDQRPHLVFSVLTSRTPPVALRSSESQPALYTVLGFCAGSTGTQPPELPHPRFRALKPDTVRPSVRLSDLAAGRLNNFDFLRFALASAVIYSHGSTGVVDVRRVADISPVRPASAAVKIGCGSGADS